MSWTYVDNEYGNYYTSQVPDISTLSQSDLPGSEFEVRQMLALWMMHGYVPYNSMGVTDSKQDRENAKRQLEALSNQLVHMIISPKHLAALMRVMGAMADKLPQKQYLKKKILTQETLWPFTSLVLHELDNMGVTVPEIDKHEFYDREGADRLFWEYTPDDDLCEGTCLAISHDNGQYRYSLDVCNLFGGTATFDSGGGFDEIPIHARQVAKIFKEQLNAHLASQSGQG